jgi:hypothetical protein
MKGSMINGNVLSPSVGLTEENKNLIIRDHNYAIMYKSVMSSKHFHALLNYNYNRLYTC